MHGSTLRRRQACECVAVGKKMMNERFVCASANGARRPRTLRGGGSGRLSQNLIEGDNKLNSSELPLHSLIQKYCRNQLFYSFPVTRILISRSRLPAAAATRCWPGGPTLVLLSSAVT